MLSVDTACDRVAKYRARAARVARTARRESVRAHAKGRAAAYAVAERMLRKLSGRKACKKT